MRILASTIGEQEGSEVELAGWVAVRRDHGKLLFIDLRDRSGVAQLVFGPSSPAYEYAKELRSEFVIRVRGKVAHRPKGMENPALPNGEFEVQVGELEILHKAETPPFPLDTDGRDIDEALRLKYRYLDLRRPRLQKNLRVRHEAARFMRDFLCEKGFLEIETPLLTKSTPEGSRDFVVPSRLHPGKFYALPQSPQQYKQLLMVAGVERYFQLSKALRDEDLRADRAFEHTQVDIEMSFVEQRDVMQLVEDMLVKLFEKYGKQIYKKPFPVFDYKDAMKQFGSDKFDLRDDGSTPLTTSKNPDEAAFAWVVNFPVFEKDPATKKLTYSHNPFTGMREEDVPRLMAGKDLEELRSLQYDLVCNGYEVGGGGIRITDPKVLEKVLEVLGHSKEKIQEQFGHILEAFTYGAPPEGGIALGFDRLVMLLTGEEYVREVIAFPQTAGGQTSVMDAPSEIAKEQLDELHLTITKEKK